MDLYGLPMGLGAQPMGVGGQLMGSPRPWAPTFHNVPVTRAVEGCAELSVRTWCIEVMSVLWVCLLSGDMEMAMGQLSNPVRLRELFLKIAERYIKVDAAQMRSATVDDSSAREAALIHDIEELRKAVSDTKTLYQRKTNVLSRKLWKMMQENTSLIKEINVFRQEMTKLRARLQLLDTAAQGTNPRHKDDYARIQSLLKEAEEARLEQFEKAGVIELYRHELRRLNLLLILMREVINNDYSPGVQELVARFQEIQLPPVVGPSKIDLVANTVAEKVQNRLAAIHPRQSCSFKEPPKSSIQAPVIPLPEQPPKEDKFHQATEHGKRIKFPKAEARAEIPPKQLSALRESLNMMNTAVYEKPLKPASEEAGKILNGGEATAQMKLESPEEDPRKFSEPGAMDITMVAHEADTSQIDLSGSTAQQKSIPVQAPLE